MRKISGLILIIVMISLTLCGCKKKTEDEVTNCDFTVVSIEDIPKELLKEIEKAKTSAFAITLTSKGYVYIAKGYGKQATGGYSICVKEVSEGKNKIFFATEIIGPRKGEAVNKLPSYPYIVVKIQDVQKNVEFR